MANEETNVIIIQNINTPHSTLITINVVAQLLLKLTSTNYLSWKIQFQSFFVGHDLLGLMDNTKPYPPTSITVNGVISPNPTFSLWIY